MCADGVSVGEGRYAFTVEVVGSIPTISTSIMAEFPTISFLVVSDLFKRYTIVVNTASRSTSIHCDECEIWVAQYEGDQLTTHTANELLERIVEDHEHQVKGVPVEIAEEPKSFYSHSD